MKMPVFAAALLMIAPQAFAIINGTLTEDYPFAKEILIDQSGRKVYCSSTQITSRVLVTAAHCVRSATRIEVVEESGNRPQAKVKVLWSGHSDAAAIVTGSDLENQVLPKLPTQVQNLDFNSNVTIVAFGRSTPQPGSGEVKRKGELQTVPAPFNALDLVPTLHYRDLSTKNVSKLVEVTQGDSGGTVLSGDELVGINVSDNAGAVGNAISLISAEGQTFLRKALK